MSTSADGATASREEVDVKDVKDSPPLETNEKSESQVPLEPVDDLFGKYGTTGPEEDDVKLTFRTVLVLFAVSVLSLAVSLAVTGPSGLVTYIVRDLGDAADSAWVTTASTCLQAATAMPISYVTDLYGRRWMLIGTTVLAVVGTFVSGSAKTMHGVIAGQCVTGFCLATKPICYAIGSEVLPRKYRDLIQLWIAWLALGGQLVGVLAGPALTQRNATKGWRWFFYLEGAIFAFSLIMLVLFYRPPPRGTVERSYSLPKRIISLDFVGWILQAGGFLLFLIGLTWGGGGKYAWHSPHVLGTLITGLLMLVLFGLYEWLARTDGLAPHALFRERNFALSCVVIFFEGIVLFAFITEYSAEVLKLWTVSAWDQGVREMGFPISGMIAVPIWALISQKYKNVKVPLALGFLFFIIATILLITAKTSSSTQSVVADCLGGIAYSSPLAFLIVTAQLSLPPKYIGTGSALLATARACGSALSVAIFNSILNPKLNDRLSGYIATAAAANGVPVAVVPSVVNATIAAVGAGFSPAKLNTIAGMNPTIIDAVFAAARLSYQQAYRFVWISACVFSAVCLVLIIPFSSVTHKFTEQIDAPAEDVRAHKTKAENDKA
jgi:MFS family permease